MSIITGDCLVELKKIENNVAQIIICDPPYNIGKDFGNNKYKLKRETYLEWCEKWVDECLRILKNNGTMFIYGYSETLADILHKIPDNVNKKWLVWHYTNKTCPNYNFWQPSHESILVLWKESKVFNRDMIRVPYTESYSKSNGRKRTPTLGRFSTGDSETLYKVHPLGALPRDVIKISSLAGKNSERVDHPTQKPLELCDTLIKSCKQTDGIVLVPFAGSGSECVSAKNNGLEYIGIEINPSYVDTINKRLSTTLIHKEDIMMSDSWKNTKAFKEYVYKKTQYDYYLENSSSSEVLQLVKLNSKVFGSVCERIIIDILNLGCRTSTENDAVYEYKDKIYKFEIKVGRYLKSSDDCMWQHIEPEHDFNYLLCCVLTFSGFEIFYLSKENIKKMICSNIIKKQGNQGFIVHKQDCESYIVKIDSNIEEIFNLKM